MAGDEKNSNMDPGTVKSFGDEWERFDQSELKGSELETIFEKYFSIFPWGDLPCDAEGFDMGCGSGRWARCVLPRVGKLNCIDPSDKALNVARLNLTEFSNANFIHASANSVPLEEESQDFGYSIGVLHHIPDTTSALSSCVRLLNSGAPFLIYLYYRFDNRPFWYRVIWKMSELLRFGISRLPDKTKNLITDSIALLIYWPLARFSWVCEKLGLNMMNIPLYFYRDKGFYTMRTDSRDRFGTPLEKRFTQKEIRLLMEEAGLTDIIISDKEPYWCAVGRRQHYA